MAMHRLSLLRPLLCQSLVVRSPLMVTSRVSAPLLYPNTPTSYPAACTRLYATKKAKAKAKGQSAKVNINSALVEDIISLDELKGEMTAVLNALKDDFTRNLSIRTQPEVDLCFPNYILVMTLLPLGLNKWELDSEKKLRKRLSVCPPKVLADVKVLIVKAQVKETDSQKVIDTDMKRALDHIVVTTQDGKFPLNQLGQVSMKSPQLIMVNMSSFPEATAAAARALRESSMNLNPEVDGTIIKVPVPKVTREHRENLAKLAKQFGNKAKDSLRKVRSNAVTQVKKTKDAQSEDTLRLVEKQIQQMADNMALDIDKQLAAKTKELLG
ncbi:hypothetical protein JOQ06_008347 [Pogonophryne albipinna]|uniref:Ribosome-recycling factor, mitochondrial n=1 Tax=Pogonophryne albipinna TaxID=1090488 RepID=A0AAD6AIQ2_9TELE|nr:hypothetical protein JOQ06_008347 [Pogonophryne albipinna]